MTTEHNQTVEALQGKLDKLERRQKRNQRHAWAEGFLSGVCGMLTPQDVAIDCGANVGDISARLLESGAQVIAYDPEPWAIKKLQRRFRDTPTLTLHNAAVGVEDGAIRLFRAKNFDDNKKSGSVKSTTVSGGAQIADGDEDGFDVAQVNFIQVIRDLHKTHGEIAFVKMDIEGAELDLLEAMDREEVLSLIRCIVVETHEKKFPDLRPRYQELRQKFAAKYKPSHVNLDWI